MTIALNPQTPKGRIKPTEQDKPTAEGCVCKREYNPKTKKTENKGDYCPPDKTPAKPSPCDPPVILSDKQKTDIINAMRAIRFPF